MIPFSIFGLLDCLKYEINLFSRIKNIFWSNAIRIYIILESVVNLIRPFRGWNFGQNLHRERCFGARPCDDPTDASSAGRDDPPQLAVGWYGRKNVKIIL